MLCRELTPLNQRHFALTAILMLVILAPLLASLQFVSGQQAQVVTRSQRVELTAGDILVVHSDRSSLQRVLVEGNLTNATIKKPPQYPANDFAITSSSTETFSLKLFFDYASDYNVSVAIQSAGITNVRDNATYYMSGGPFELDVTAIFDPRLNTPDVALSVTSPDSFAGWMGKFSEAFPVWVKVLYLFLGVQFFAVGGLWIRRETTRKESSAQHLDGGDKAFLWVDIAYKFLLVSFLAIILIMGGELLVLFILRFMFLVSLNLLSLWDLFVLGFAAGVVVIAYLLRFILEKAFDLKPMEDE